MNAQSYEYEPLPDELVEVDPLDTPSALVPAEPKEIAVPEGPRFLNPSEVPDLDGMEPGVSLAAQYVEFETPETKKRGVLIGYNQFTGQDGHTKPLAMFQNRDGIWVNAGSNLLAQVRNVPIGTPVEVTYKGKVKTGNGNNVKVFEVRLLNVKPAPAKPEVGNIGQGVKVPSKAK